MSLFSFFSRRDKKNNKKSAKPTRSKAKLTVEALEDRFLPSSSTISGFVFADANNNGLYDPGEAPIANAPVQLRDAGNIIIGNTTTDANGFYKFNQNNSINATPVTLTKTLSFPTTQTDYTLAGGVDQFDPSLGQLQSVQITHDGSITSDISVENTSTISTSVIKGVVSGSLELTGPSVDIALSLSQNAGTFSASQFDGTLDYTGTSGTDFGAKQASGNKAVTLTGASMNPYIGTGQVSMTENAVASSSASGGGNLNVSLNSTGKSTVTVVYSYIPSNDLKPGDYVVIQTVQPPGYTDGKESAAGVVIPHQPNVDVIPVTLDGINDSSNNDFGKLTPAGISGYVYADGNNNGLKEPGEAGIPGSTITLTGTNDLGAVSQTATTDASGLYQFTNLRPGSYTVQETQPSNWLDGMDTAGSLGGSVTNDQIANITLPSGASSMGNNFGELKAAGLSGYVYSDANNNGIKEGGEAGIGGVTITLSGNDDLGAVSQTAVTDANGFYQFTSLRPGSYTAQETQPAGWLDGKDTAGSLGGAVTDDQIAGINIAAGATALNNNFGELKSSSVSGYVYADGNNNGFKDPGEAGIGGTTITLTGFNSTGPVNQTASTDGNGFYQFINLAPGTYSVQETQPANWMDGKDSAGSLGGTVTNDLIAAINVPAGAAALNNNFGELKSSSIAGFVYADGNNNGVKDPGEAGIAGTTITLTGTNSAGAVNQTTSTDATGFYQFSNLSPGTYVISETQPATWLNGKDAIGSQGGTQGIDVFSNVILPAGVDGINNNFGELMSAGLSGFVYVDANNNGTKDPGEAGIPASIVTLAGFNDQGPISLAVATDANGFYQFQNLRPGTYALTETQPATYLDGKDAIGSQGGIMANDNFSNIVLAAGVLGTNNNFGELSPANADLGIVKTASASTVLVGSTINYTLTVTNYGTYAAQNVQIVDNLPPDATYLSASGTGWSVTQANGTITATMPALAAGATAQLNVALKAPIVPDSLVNTSIVSSSTPDSNPNNNTSTVTVTVYNQPGTTFPQGITPLAINFGKLPPLGKIQLITPNAAAYINPVLLGEMTYVSGAYATFLGRAPSQSEFATAVSQMTAGVSAATIAGNLWNSSEHRAQQASMLYKTFLGRAPSSGELAAAVQTLQSGTSEINFSLSLVNSAEFQSTHATPTTIVTGLYLDVLNQVPDTSTALQATSMLSNQSLSAFAQSLMNSTAGLGNIVNSAYLAILRRAASQAEIQSWVSQLQGNTASIDQMEISLLSSPEFYQLALKSTTV